MFGLFSYLDRSIMTLMLRFWSLLKYFYILWQKPVQSTLCPAGVTPALFAVPLGNEAEKSVFIYLTRLHAVSLRGSGNQIHFIQGGKVFFLKLFFYSLVNGRGELNKTLYY
ncbi:hypothetical protein XENOCAPTIV_004742 [Xenoophorus captivus]|uniref:Uncharacterized protein n=1 Tax=Xenoophorus captivus TaxID=1517983 RepID=A0ABV0R6W4_9TELE